MRDCAGVGEVVDASEASEGHVDGAGEEVEKHAHAGGGWMCDGEDDGRNGGVGGGGGGGGSVVVVMVGLLMMMLSF